jgi:branched-chain amino acid transport system permease protein
MDTFLHQIFSGIAMGGIYACIALSLVMIYQATHLINFAQGEMAMFSAFIALALMNAGVPYWWSFLLTLMISFAGGVAIERLLIRPFGDNAGLPVVIVMIGLLVILNSIAGWIWSYNVKSFPSPFANVSVLGNRFSSAHEMGSMLIMTLMMGVLFFFFRYSSLGLAMRAAAQNPKSSRLVGIRVGWMYALGWGLAAVIGAVAAMLVANVVFLEPNMMGGMLLYGFAGALLGGISNPWGAVVGGIIVGVLENLLGAYVIGTDLKLPAALVLIIGVLTVVPQGLFGKVIVKRV